MPSPGGRFGPYHTGRLHSFRIMATSFSSTRIERLNRFNHSHQRDLGFGGAQTKPRAKALTVYLSYCYSFVNVLDVYHYYAHYPPRVKCQLFYIWRSGFSSPGRFHDHPLSSNLPHFRPWPTSAILHKVGAFCRTDVQTSAGSSNEAADHFQASRRPPGYAWHLSFALLLPLAKRPSPPHAVTTTIRILYLDVPAVAPNSRSKRSPSPTHALIPF